MPDILHIEAMLEAIVENYKEEPNVNNAWNHKLMIEVLLLVASRPQETFVELGQLLGSLCVQFVENWLVERVNLQR